MTQLNPANKKIKAQYLPIFNTNPRQDLTRHFCSDGVPLMSKCKLVHIPLPFNRKSLLNMRPTLPNVCQDVTANTHID